MNTLKSVLSDWITKNKEIISQELCSIQNSLDLLKDVIGDWQDSLDGASDALSEIVEMVSSLPDELPMPENISSDTPNEIKSLLRAIGDLDGPANNWGFYDMIKVAKEADRHADLLTDIIVTVRCLIPDELLYFEEESSGEGK